MIEYNPNFIKGVLLIALAVSGNFVGNTLGCKTQYYMTNNMYIKHLVLISIIYFTISFSSKKDSNPLEYMKTTFFLWIIYLLFTKQTILFTGISALLLFTSYLLDSYITYYNELINNETDNKIKRQYKKTLSKITKARTVVFYCAIMTIVVGFSIYFFDKYSEYSSNFDIVKFILGKTSCASLS
jgi:Ca2+/Na+ antiporter